jgi:hypothetical protein
MNCLRAIAWGLNTACDILWPEPEPLADYSEMLAAAEAETEVWEPMEPGANELPDELWQNEGLDALNLIAVYVEDIRNTLQPQTCEGCGCTKVLAHTIDCPTALAEAHAIRPAPPEQFAEKAAYWMRRYADSNLCEAPTYWHERADALDAK